MFSRDTTDDGFSLATERLCLRWPRLADAATIERLAGDHAVADMTAQIPHPYPAGAAGGFIFGARQANACGTGLTLALTLRRRSRDVIGMIHVSPSPDEHEGEGAEAPLLGYWLAREHWGEGLMSEAVAAMLDCVFARSGSPIVRAEVRSINGPSLRVLQKAGFMLCDTALAAFPARGGMFPVYRLKLSRTAWAAEQGQRRCDDATRIGEPQAA